MVLRHVTVEVPSPWFSSLTNSTAGLLCHETRSLEISGTKFTALCAIKLRVNWSVRCLVVSAALGASTISARTRVWVSPGVESRVPSAYSSRALTPSPSLSAAGSPARPNGSSSPGAPWSERLATQFAATPWSGTGEVGCFRTREDPRPSAAGGHGRSLS